MPGQYDIDLKQGETWVREIVWKDAAGTAVTVTGYTAALMARRKIADTATLLSLSSAGVSPAIVVGTTDGKFTITITAAVSAALDFETAVYDFKVTSSTGIVTYLLEGTITLSKAVTR
ncbi:MAG: hypothetical protein WC208_14930 [Gallionella sp.]|jgi:hypothetical protein